MTASCGEAERSSSSERAADYLQALQDTKQAPDQAADSCLALEDEPLAADCIWALVEIEARDEPQRAAVTCQRLDETARGECFFLVAEVSDDSSWCRRASPFTENCQAHALEAPLRTLDLRSSSDPERLEATLAGLLLDQGFPLDNVLLWTTGWLGVLEVNPSAQPTWCRSLRHAAARRGCREAWVTAPKE